MIAEYRPSSTRPTEPQPESVGREDHNWQQAFLSLLPGIRRRAEAQFRYLSPELHEEMIQETIARALIDYVRLIEQKKEHLAYATPLARYAVAQVRQGRRVGCRLNIRDVSSEYCRRRKRATLISLDQLEESSGDWRQILVEDRRATPADTAAARLDIGKWLDELPKRSRRLALRLAKGETTARAAQEFNISPGRVSQLRRELHRSWQAFQGEPASVKL